MRWIAACAGAALLSGLAGIAAGQDQEAGPDERDVGAEVDALLEQLAADPEPDQSEADEAGAAQDTTEAPTEDAGPDTVAPERPSGPRDLRGRDVLDGFDPESSGPSDPIEMGTDPEPTQTDSPASETLAPIGGDTPVDASRPDVEVDPNAGVDAEDEGPVVLLPSDAYLKKPGVVLRGLDKITGRYSDMELVPDTPIEFGSLEVTLKACYQTPPDVLPESAAFLQIRSLRPIAPEAMTEEMAARLAEFPEGSEERRKPRVFSGWMFASSPGLNALEHPVYDIWVMSCTAS